MKKNTVTSSIIALVSLILFNSCSGGDDAPPPPVVQNNPPEIPNLIFPTNNLICTGIDLEFSWNPAIDPEENEITYLIQIAEQDNFQDIVFSQTLTSTSTSFNLERGVTYHWRVRAIDDQGNESGFTNSQNFFTEPEATISTIPQTPILIAPVKGDIVQNNTVTLQWEVVNEQNANLKYDVYFGESTPPVLFAENIDNTSFEIVDLNPETLYFWRIVVKDTQLNAAISQIVEFMTE